MNWKESVLKWSAGTLNVRLGTQQFTLSVEPFELRVAPEVQGRAEIYLINVNDKWQYYTALGHVSESETMPPAVSSWNRVLLATIEYTAAPTAQELVSGHSRATENRVTYTHTGLVLDTVGFNPNNYNDPELKQQAQEEVDARLVELKDVISKTIEQTSNVEKSIQQRINDIDDYEDYKTNLENIKQQYKDNKDKTVWTMKEAYALGTLYGWNLGADFSWTHFQEDMRSEDAMYHKRYLQMIRSSLTIWADTHNNVIQISKDDLAELRTNCSEIVLQFKAQLVEVQ